MDITFAPDLDKQTFEGVELDTPYSLLYGLPTAPFNAFYYGPPGCGKTTLVIGTIKTMRRHGLAKKVLYVAAEQNGPDDDLQDLIRRFDLKADSHLAFSDFSTLDALKKAVSAQGFDCVVFDSASYIDRFGYKLVGFLKWATRQGVSCLFIAHVTKGGTYKGSSDLPHDVDAVIRCWKDGQKHIAQAEKNRKSRGRGLNAIEIPMTWTDATPKGSTAKAAPKGAKATPTKESTPRRRRRNPSRHVQRSSVNLDDLSDRISNL